MEIRENKFGFGLLLIIALAVGGMMRLFGFFDESKPQEMPEISYEMPRPKDTLVGDFALSGREIDRQYVNPFAKQIAPKKELKPATPPVVRSIAKTGPSVVAVSGGTYYKNPRTQVNVVDRDHAAGTGGQTPQVGTPGPRPSAADQNRDDNRIAADHRSAGQWRALLLADPSKANMDKFIAAYQKNEVDAATFYSVNDELLKSGKANDEYIALYGLNKVGTSQAFALVARNQSTLAESVKTSATAVLNSYASIGRHTALLQSLQNSDATVAVAAAKVVLASLQGGTATANLDPRSVRGSSTTSNASSYASFSTVFTRWAASGNSTLAGIANSILPLLPRSQA